MSRSIRLSTRTARPSDTATGYQTRSDRQRTLHATADYIHDMTDELGRMAEEAGFDLLAYILDMAHIEAEHVKKRTSPGPDAAVSVLEQDET